MQDGFTICGLGACFLVGQIEGMPDWLSDVSSMGILGFVVYFILARIEPALSRLDNSIVKLSENIATLKNESQNIEDELEKIEEKLEK